MPKLGGRPNNSLKRAPAWRPRLPRVLIACEGAVTEPDYIRFIRHRERLPIDLVIESGATPKRVVETTVEYLRRAERSRQPADRFSEAWCVFDIDEHPLVEDARQQAVAHGIKLAISNPCFELWVLLHYQDQNGHIHRHAVQSKCRRHISGYQKSLPCEELLERYTDAEERAVKLAERNRARGAEGANPSTMVHELVRALRSYRREDSA